MTDSGVEIRSGSPARPAGLWKAFLRGGPVGLVYAARLTWQQGRLAHLQACVQREKTLHRENMALLARELDDAAKVLASTNHAAAQHWKQFEVRP